MEMICVTGAGKSTQSTPTSRQGTFVALRHRNFRLMWISLIVSNSGTWLQTVAQDFLVYQVTHSAWILGVVNGVRAVALIGLAFVGGTIADRLDQRKLLIFTQSCMAVTAAVLGLLIQLHMIQVWHIIVISFINALLLAVDQPARQSLLPRLVPREDLMNAVALNSVTFTGAAAFGPALAGPVIATLGMTSGFYMNALSFFVVIWAVWAIRLPAATERRQPEPVGEAIVSGLRYVRSSPTILLLVSLLTVFSFFATPYQATLPVFAERVFGGGVTVLGNLRAAMGIGALVGGFMLARFATFPRKDWLVVGGCLAYSAALLAFSATGWLPGAVALLFTGSLVMTVFQSTAQTLMQHVTADHMRGRVMSLFAVSVIGMWPLGSLPMGWATDKFGAPAAVAGGAAIAGVFALVLAGRAQRLLAPPAGKIADNA
jgi:MFS family permease